MKNKIPYIAIITVVTLIQSCSINKNNKEADLELNKLKNKYIVTDNYVEETIVYENYFKDSVLIQLINNVLSNNNDLISAIKQLQANQAVLKATKLNYLPDVNLQINPSIQRLSKNSMIGGFADDFIYEDHTISANLTWELDLWGKLKSERAEAKALYLSQAENIRAIKIQLIAQTATIYYNLVFLANQHNELQNLKNIASNSVQLLQQQYKYGDATSIAVKQANDQVLDLENTIIEVNQSIKNQEIVLSSLLGKYPEEYNFNSDITNYDFSYKKNTKISIVQLQNRPDVKRAELQLKAANARVGINNAALYPSIVISAQGGLNSVMATNIFNVPASLFGNLAGSITQPLLNKRRLKSNLEQAKFTRDASIATFKQEVVKSVGEVNEVMNNIEFLDQKKNISTFKLSNLAHTMDDAQKLYQFGEITYLEVLAVQQLYIQANINYLDINRKAIDAYINLFKAIGG